MREMKMVLRRREQGARAAQPHLHKRNGHQPVLVRGQPVERRCSNDVQRQVPCAHVDGARFKLRRAPSPTSSSEHRSNEAGEQRPTVRASPGPERVLRRPFPKLVEQRERRLDVLERRRRHRQHRLERGVHELGGGRRRDPGGVAEEGPQLFPRLPNLRARTRWIRVPNGGIPIKRCLLGARLRLL